MSENSGWFITNDFGITGVYQVLAENFTRLFRKKSFVHLYTKETMDEMEFTEAESNMNDLWSEYQEYPGAYYDDDAEGEDGEGEQENLDDLF